MKKLLLISLGALMIASCAKDKKDYKTKPGRS